MSELKPRSDMGCQGSNRTPSSTMACSSSNLCCSNARAVPRGAVADIRTSQILQRLWGSTTSSVRGC
eukprot:8360210-Pyramimonas_sp.AAC.1